MVDEVFARLVAEEVKNKVSQGQSEYLRLPENWSRWQRALVALVDNLNSQLIEIERYKTDMTERYSALGEAGVKLLAETLSEAESREKKASRFKFHVETRLDEVTRMIASGTDAVDERVKMVDFLRKAIDQHRKMVLDYEYEPTPIDRALWAAAEGLWEFDNITMADLG